ncbi:uncharacterized protein LOC119452719 [Dermacentor silvarum]|nr:uncharacterized protein LOC119452719 [Dermacentor silvarum]
MFRAIATMTNLHELVITGTGAAPLVLLEALCTLLLDTTSLTTLSMSGLVIDAAHRMRVVASLRHNVTIENLSLHGSIVHSYLSNGVSGFTVFLSNSTRLGSLSMEVVESDAAKTHMDLMCVIPPLVDRGTLWKLKLAGFLLNADCACLLAQLVSRKDGLLEHLDIGGCYWSAEESPPGSSRVEARTTDWEEPDPAISKLICPWLQAFDDTARIELSFLALSFVGLQPEHLAALFNTATTFQYLATISLRDVALHELNEVCRIIRETDMSGRVRIEGEYLVDSAALSMLHEFPEGLRHVAVSSICEPRPEVFQNTVRLACSWYQVTTLHLFLTQNVVGDVVTIRSLSKYLGVAIPLRELALTGCYQPDLSLCLRGAGTSRTVLLEAIFENPGIQVLRIDGFRLGRANLCFLAYELVASETLCEVSFESPDRLENEAFVQLLAADVRENTTILRLQVLESVDGETQGERFVVEDVLGRNLGYLTCAAHFVVEEARLTRCAVAFATVSCSPALVEKVQKLAYVDGAEATNMIRRILE